MANKKLFWIVFFILSCCEFGQFVYSKTTAVNAPQDKSYHSVLHSREQQALSNELVFNAKSTNNLLPR